MSDDDFDIMNEEHNEIKQSIVSEDTEEYEHQIDDVDDDDENNSSENDEYDDDDDKSSSWKDELIASWKQHTVAIMVAIVATFIAYSFQKQIFNNQNGGLYSSSTMTMAPTTLQLTRFLENQNQQQQQHSHLDNYQRTSNITFCHDNALSIKPNLSSSLVLMDFHVPKELITTMEIHYKVDIDYDNHYENVFDLIAKEQKSTTLNLIPTGHSQYQCIQDQIQQQETTKDFIRGYTFYYQSPTIQSMYGVNDNNDDNNKRSKKVLSVMASANNKDSDESINQIMSATLSFTGFAAKFINLSPKPILLYWDGNGDGVRSLVGEISPFEAISTATTPGQSFSISPIFDHTIEYERWILTADDPIMYYEPKNKNILSSTELQLYNIQLLNKEFAKHYQIHSKRPWLAHFPRSFPIHPMYDAHYFGQIHRISKQQPQQDNDNASPNNNDDSFYSLSVVSVTPRVFAIDNFMSHEECDTLIKLANHHGMKQSTVYAGGNNGGGSTTTKQRNIGTRSSSNTWLARDTTTLTDEIYRRAGTILQMNETLFNPTYVDDNLHAHTHSMTESLQIIRYKKKQLYTPHHDWVVPSQIHRYQPTRYATILMYLNDNFDGGHTVFPRATNQHYHDGIRIVPKKGSAILFYNILPDGNMDDLSQHSSEKVTNGTKVSIFFSYSLLCNYRFTGLYDSSFMLLLLFIFISYIKNSMLRIYGTFSSVCKN